MTAINYLLVSFLFVFGQYTPNSCHWHESVGLSNASDLLEWIPVMQKGKCLCFQVFSVSRVAAAVILSFSCIYLLAGYNRISANLFRFNLDIHLSMRAYLLGVLHAMRAYQLRNNSCKFKKRKLNDSLWDAHIFIFQIFQFRFLAEKSNGF